MHDLTLAICMYNAEQYIEETLQSVLAQTIQDFHLMIVNDCCTDSSAKIVEEFFKVNPRQYELISFESNQGICHARHYAERHAQTRYMMFLDADDLLKSSAVETMYKKIIFDDDLMAVGCYLEYIDVGGKKIGGGLFLGETTKEGFYEKAKRRKLIFMQPTAIYDREIALSVGGYQIEGFPNGKPRYQDYCEDLDLWTRMSDLYNVGKAIIVVPEILCSYRKGSGLSSSTFNMILKMRYIKCNLLRRRNGIEELSFIEFRDCISSLELKKIQNEAKSADALRSGVILLKRKCFSKAIWQIFISLWYKPSYIFDKLKYNLKIFKR